VIDAILDLLVERGPRARTANIARRAGVTRGALHHHFSSKDDLVAQPVEALLHSAIRDIRALATHVQRGAMSLSGFIDTVGHVLAAIIRRDA
jgi:AcrR family transcriptional regulator